MGFKVKLVLDKAHESLRSPPPQKNLYFVCL